jgi:tRNA dimethylallyltransferase
MDFRLKAILNIPLNIDLLMVLGPTASGKTSLAIQLAQQHNGEIISADSRQVYQQMDIGTGKDLNQYHAANIPYHLINIAKPGEKYNLHRFQQDFEKAFKAIQSKRKLPIVCGGTGLYLESILQPKGQTQIPENTALRSKLMVMEHQELRDIWFNTKKDSRQTNPDLSTKKRCIRALEIQYFLNLNPDFIMEERTIPKYYIVGINPCRDVRREKIKTRLNDRLKQGMVAEVAALLASGISEETLVYYGLEYKYISWYLNGKMNYEEMTKQLLIAIQQYAKRQMTWFRKMEKIYPIHWINV